MTTPSCQQCGSEAVVVVQTPPDDRDAEPDRLRCLACGALQVETRSLPVQPRGA